MYVIHANTPEILMTQIVEIVTIQMDTAGQQIIAARTQRDKLAALAVQNSMRSLLWMLKDALAKIGATQ